MFFQMYWYGTTRETIMDVIYTPQWSPKDIRHFGYPKGRGPHDYHGFVIKDPDDLILDKTSTIHVGLGGTGSTPWVEHGTTYKDRYVYHTVSMYGCLITFFAYEVIRNNNPRQKSSCTVRNVYGCRFLEVGDDLKLHFEVVRVTLSTTVLTSPDSIVSIVTDWMDFHPGVHPTGQFDKRDPLMGFWISKQPAALIPDNYLVEKVELGFSRDVCVGMSDAYLDAMEQLPTTKMNNIANIIDILSTVKDILLAVLGGRLDKIKSIGDLASKAWLGYRYQYCTTVSDLQDAVDQMCRLYDLSNQKVIVTRGIARYYEDDGTETVFRCSVELPLTQLYEVQSFAEKYGIQLSAYNAWDLVPYSFIVDWFLDIGSWLEYYERVNFSFKFTPSKVWYSIKKSKTYSTDSFYSEFYRWAGEPAAFVPHYTSYKASNVTLVKRLLDIIAIVRR